MILFFRSRIILIYGENIINVYKNVDKDVNNKMMSQHRSYFLKVKGSDVHLKKVKIIRFVRILNYF